MDTPNGTLSTIEKAAIEAHIGLEEGEGLSFYNIFKAGVEWHRNHVWHDYTLEPPTNFGETLIVLCKNKNKEDGIWLADIIQSWEGEYKPRENWEKPVKWAYLADLLPTTSNNCYQSNNKKFVIEGTSLESLKNDEKVTVLIKRNNEMS